VVVGVFIVFLLLYNVSMLLLSLVLFAALLLTAGSMSERFSRPGVGA
jgi:hypothetical protein